MSIFVWELPNWEGEGCYMQDHLGVQKALREELRQWELVRCDRGRA